MRSISIFSGGDDCFCEEVHCCLGCSYSYSVSGLTNYCIAVNWYYLAPFWVDSLLCYALAGVMWRYGGGFVMLCWWWHGNQRNMKSKSIVSDRCESVCLSVGQSSLWDVSLRCVCEMCLFSRHLSYLSFLFAIFPFLKYSLSSPGQQGGPSWEYQ